MDKHHFQIKIIRNLYETNDINIIFITDHINNDYGIVFVEASIPFSFVGSKKTVAQDILKLLTQ